MRTRRQFLVALAVLAAPIAPLAAYAESRRERSRRILFQRLGSAASQDEGRRAEDDIWRMWMALAPTPAVEEAVAEAMRKRERYDWDGALAILDVVVRDAPAYAEGWNQRAFVRFLKQDFDGSLEDIERALALEPLHFAALAGKAMILMRQGRMEIGQASLRRAVEIHPWLKERSMLIPQPGEIPPGPGKDI
ncbi:hypothetical protein [Mesorhizobium sp. CAU 1741]|uniref:tetratricopeptide repeat protein n=1 Tax=Mesorhizobium sp. CAU 1741 TaxID=3140366 RepID=UPI00325A8ABC